MPRKSDPNAGKLKIGDNWNAITIIAYSQTNPLKAIAEFVENSIDAKAKHIRIIRGKHAHEPYLKIIDDGHGIDDFRYVATHIGDSIKRRLKKQGAEHLQGEFGIGLLSFWTVGEQLMLTSTGSEGVTRRMKLVKNNPGYKISTVNELFAGKTGTELHITPLLPGIRQLSGEKIQNYLASELRDRIAKSGVEIRIKDRSARKELLVEPRKFAGNLIHNLPQVNSPFGEIYCELYLNAPSPENAIGLYKMGTRVIRNITTLEAFDRPPWNSQLLEGLIDASFLQLTPGTRDGIVLDDRYESFTVSAAACEKMLTELINEQKRAEEEQVSRNILKKISKAMQEALLFLPAEEYSWLQVQEKRKTRVLHVPAPGTAGMADGTEGETAPFTEGEAEREEMQSIFITESVSEPERKREFFEFPGPMHSVRISPSSAVISIGGAKKFQVKVRDRKGVPIDEELAISWETSNGLGALSDSSGEVVEFSASSEPGIEELTVQVTQHDKTVSATAVITVTRELFDRKSGEVEASGQKTGRGLPGYTYIHKPGELWRSSYDPERGIIIINSGNADFIYASHTRSRKLRYISKLYAKELVMINFPEADKNQLLERMIELQLYSEENL